MAIEYVLLGNVYWANFKTRYHKPQPAPPVRPTVAALVATASAAIAAIAAAVPPPRTRKPRRTRSKPAPR